MFFVLTGIVSAVLKDIGSLFIVFVGSGGLLHASSGEQIDSTAHTEDSSCGGIGDACW